MATKEQKNSRRLPPGGRVTRRERLALTTITIAFGLLLTVWATLTPMFQAPDEIAHFDASAQVALGGGWPAPGTLTMLSASKEAYTSADSTLHDQRPSYGTLIREFPGHISGINQMTQHPPTYYLLGATLLRLLNFTHHNWDVGVLALRLMDVLMVTPVPIFVWMTVRRITRSPRTALVGAMALFAVPQLASIGSSVTNDAPLILLGAVLAWLGARLLTGDLRWRTLVAFGAALGIAAAAKGTALPLIPFAIAVVVVSGHGALRPQLRFVRLLIVGVLTAALSGWWWLHNLIAYHSLQPDGLSLPKASFDPGQTPSYGIFMNQAWSRLTASFWGQFGRNQFPMSPIVTDVLTVVALFTVAAFAFRNRRQWAVSIPFAIMVIGPILSLLWLSWTTYERTRLFAGLQGRYFFSGIVAALVLAALAWRDMLPEAKSRQRAGRIVAIAAPLIGLYGLSLAFRSFYESTNLVVTRTGLGHLFAMSPIGKIGLGVLLLALAVIWLLSIVQVWIVTGDSGDKRGDTPASAGARGPKVRGRRAMTAPTMEPAASDPAGVVDLGAQTQGSGTAAG